jgi:mono/diheme cytochrome c family protein
MATPFAMPTFAWKLEDREIADVATYIRNSWGNSAPAVSAGDVAKLRRRVAAHPIRKPATKA